MFMHDKLMEIGKSLVGIGPGWSPGFFIEEEYILTAGHCLKSRGTRVEINLRDGRTIPGHIEAIDTDYDIGLVHVDHKAHNMPHLSLAKYPIFRRDKLPAAAALLRTETNHNGHPFEIEYGECLGLDRSWTVVGKLRLKIVSKPGYSGAPILDKEGRVIGILTNGNDVGDVWATPHDQIDTFLLW